MGAPLRVDVNPEFFAWACERARLAPEALVAGFPKIAEWMRGETRPTLRQLETFAKTTHTPVGFFFLDEPPEERIPIPDFRTVPGARDQRPSADLLETIHICQQRQEWYRDEVRMRGEEPLAFVGSATTGHGATETASDIRNALRLDDVAAVARATWDDVRRRFVEQADAAGILVMSNGIVGSNTHRPLDPEEFRGFALADPVAPLVFINARDSVSAQRFTLAHEIAHLWLGETGISDLGWSDQPIDGVEDWCNRVAAELLAPADDVLREFDSSRDFVSELERLANRYKVSTLVVLRRLYETGLLGRDAMWSAFRDEQRRLSELPRGDRGESGGDFYRTLFVRVGRRFASALAVSTLEGRTLFRDAYRMLGLRKAATFDAMVEKLGLA